MNCDFSWAFRGSICSRGQNHLVPSTREGGQCWPYTGAGLVQQHQGGSDCIGNFMWWGLRKLTVSQSLFQRACAADSSAHKKMKERGDNRPSQFYLGEERKYSGKQRLKMVNHGQRTSGRTGNEAAWKGRDWEEVMAESLA